MKGLKLPMHILHWRIWDGLFGKHYKSFRNLKVILQHFLSKIIEIYQFFDAKFGLHHGPYIIHFLEALHVYAQDMLEYFEIVKSDRISYIPGQETPNTLRHLVLIFIFRKLFFFKWFFLENVIFRNGAKAKLYYTSFWDKFGMNINYFGMHPKT